MIEYSSLIIDEIVRKIYQDLDCIWFDDQQEFNEFVITLESKFKDLIDDIKGTLI